MTDLGLSISNYGQPTGGTSPLLDALGAERATYRTTNEVGQDNAYRQRVAAVSDVVSPDAVRRALARAFRQAGGSQAWALQEVGSPLFEGAFFDRAADPNGDFTDTNCLLFTTTGLAPKTFVAGEMVRWLDVNGDIVCQGWVGGGAGLCGTTWAAATAYALNACVVPNPSNGYVYQAVAETPGGATGALQPTWPTTLGTTVVDNQVTWVCKGAAATPGYLPSGQFCFVMHAWRGPVRQTLSAGDYIQGWQSGAVYTPATVAVAGSASAMAQSVWLDYASFRGYFLVQVPDGEQGEYGCAFSLKGDLGAYDAFYDVRRPVGAPVTPFIPVNFFDGKKQTLLSSPYLQVYKAVERARAGGVGWDMYILTPTGGI